MTVENGNPAAQVLAYVPQDWAGVAVRVHGQPAKPTLVKALGERCLLIDVVQGDSAIEVSESKGPQAAKPTTVEYVNPSEEVWREAAERLLYHNLEHRAYAKDGKSCLALNALRPGGGSVDFYLLSKDKAGGLKIKVKGAQSGGILEAALLAGDVWTYRIKDDFRGWKEFHVRKDQMTPGSTRRNFAPATAFFLRAYPVGGEPIAVADVHLIPAAEGDLPEPGKAEKRRLVVFKTKTAPVIDGIGKEPCWKTCEVGTDFYKYSTESPAEAKTEVRVCYDDQYLYLLFDNLEPITSLAAARVPEAQVFLTDHAHLFVDPFKDSVRYVEIAVDTAGTVADIKNGESGGDMKWNGSYEVKTALNYNVGWTAEMKIPFKTLGKSPKAGDVWGVTFARIDNSKEFSVWTTGQWNDPSGFGDLVFSGETK